VRWLGKTSFFFLGQLEERKDEEKEREYFTEMPSKSYLELASLLLKRLAEIHLKIRYLVYSLELFIIQLLYGFRVWMA
jgi:hypothetical protein